jgi:MOSC domain-containing protein YiiM
VRGSVVSIQIAPSGEAPLRAVPEVRAVAGRGLEGDRYFLGAGTYSDKPGPDRNVTLIEAEALEALARDDGVQLAEGESRRNIVTRGVALNHLVGRTFQVGEVTLRGVRLCEPCEHMEKLSGKKGARKGLVHRGGLRAEIVQGGVIRAGDPVVAAET